MPRIEYLVSLSLAIAYVGYVLVIMVRGLQMQAPLGDLGEFLLVFLSVIAFVVGLLRDEAKRKPIPNEETTS